MSASARRKRVFILGGGASLGAHQVGAIKRLEEEGITPDAIVGSSIGVINACLYASGGVENMERAWLEGILVRLRGHSGRRSSSSGRISSCLEP